MLGKEISCKLALYFSWIVSAPVAIIFESEPFSKADGDGAFLSSFLEC